MPKVGIVYIVGAGPGDPELITVRGLKCLQQADVVVYDRLVNQELLTEGPLHARYIYVGKGPGAHRHTQAEINTILIREAAQGNIVVRLKGGDPFVFGRGGEECQALAEADIPFEVVPGVTSAVAVPAYAGIPLTHRDHANAFTVVTGHTAGADSCQIDWQALPQTGTLVILMGVGNLAQITPRLIAQGRASNTPAAVIGQGATQDQVTVTGVLADIAEKARDIQPPATIVIGDVVALNDQIAWFDPSKPSKHTGTFTPLTPQAKNGHFVPGKEMSPLNPNPDEPEPKRKVDPQKFLPKKQESNGLGSNGPALKEGQVGSTVQAIGAKNQTPDEGGSMVEAAPSTPPFDWSPAMLPHLSRRFEAGQPQDLLDLALAEFGDEIVMATGFGVSGVVLMHMVSQLRPETPVFYLQTDLLFPETLALRDKLRERLGIKFTEVHSGLSLESQSDQYQPELWQHNPDLCCHLRKVEPLRRFLADKKAWITGIRRDQSPTRANTPLVAWDKANNLIKLNPLAD